MIDIFSIKKNHIFVSRAATAIFLILETILKKGSKVLVPANLCYAAIYPIIYSGNKPMFCDCDRESGNLTLNILNKYIKEIDAVIIPHMYGNPVEDIQEIVNECHKNNVLVIEDCAAAMGAHVKEKMCGSFGDYSVFSTGYSKTIDFGGGGILLSDNNLSELNNVNKILNRKIKDLEEKERKYSKFYRKIRNGEIGYEDNEWVKLNKESKDIFIYYDASKDNELQKINEILEKTIDRRKMNRELYSSLLSNNHAIKEYSFNDGAVPWRFCFFVEEKYNKEFIEYLLNNNVPISDWYPNVTPIFGERILFDNIDIMEKQILNLPIPETEENIKKYCEIINSFTINKN